MGLKSSIRFQGLTRLIQGIERGKVRATPEINKLTKKAGSGILELYKENLSGSQPSTAAQPLPVGIRTGTLLAGAEMVQVNQYRADIKNDVEYAAFLEFGTSRMSPRPALRVAVETYTNGDLPNDANQVMGRIWRE